MIATIEQVVAEVDVSQAEVTAWIDKRWVLASEEDGRYLFDDADLARIKLIAELHRDLGVNEEAMPLVLRLLDQIYTLRRVLGELHDAIEELPKDVRVELQSRLSKATDL